MTHDSSTSAAGIGVPDDAAADPEMDRAVGDANVRIVSARSRSPFGVDAAERAHRRAAADGLERGDQVERGDLRAAGDRAARAASPRAAP